MDGVEGRHYIENSILGYVACSGQCVTRPCSSGRKNLELTLLKNGKLYSLVKFMDNQKTFVVEKELFENFPIHTFRLFGLKPNKVICRLAQ